MIVQIDPTKASSFSPKIDPALSKMIPNRKLMIIYFHGVSCMGKSELLKRFSANFRSINVTPVKVSLDRIAKGIIDKYKEDHPEYKGEEHFTLNMKQILDTFHETILQSLDCMPTNQSHALMIDDCFISIPLMKKLVDKANLLFSQVKVMKIYPKDLKEMKISEDWSIDLSFQFVLNLCHRVLNRGFHETYTYRVEKKVQLVLSWVLVYKGKPSEEEEGFLHDLDYLLSPTEFHIEHAVTDNSSQVKLIEDQLKRCLSTIVPFESPVTTGIDELSKLIALIDQSKEELKPLLSYGRIESWDHQLSQSSLFFQTAN